MKIPKTKRLEPRSVWKRHLRRTVQNINPLPAPTEEEKYDAILVLSEPLNEMIPGLWVEAHRIFEEASHPDAENRRWREAQAAHRRAMKGEAHHGSVHQKSSGAGDD